MSKQYFLSFMMVLSLIMFSSLAQAQNGLFYDDFEDGNANGWEPYNSSNWQVVMNDGDHAYYQKNTNLGSHAGQQLNEWSIYDGQDFENIILTLEIKSPENLDVNQQADYAVIFNYQDDDNYYFAFFNSARNTTSLVLRRKGVETTLVTYSSSTIEDNKYHTVAIKTMNGSISVMANEHTIMESYDTTFLSGSIGLGVRDDAAYFDEVFVADNVESTCDFWEDFNDDILDGWTMHNSDFWSTKYHDGDYSLWLHSNSGSTHNDNLGEWVTINDLYLSDFTFEGDLESNEYSDPTADLAVLFCYQDPDNYYYAMFNRGQGNTSLWRWQNGVGHLIDTYSPGTLPDQRWHHVKITRQSGDIKVYYDNDLILQGYDNNLNSGRIGLGSKDDTGWFDDICINQHNACEITVLQPNGGESWLENTWQDINWSSQNTSGNVRLYYSTNGGASWISITNSTPDDGHYQWYVPSVSSDQTNCRVRVQDVDDSGCYDISDASFTIRDNTPCSINVIEPNGGEIWYESTEYDIRWQSQNTSGTVKILFSSDGGSNWSNITTGTEDDGLYRWLTFPVVSDLNSCRIRVEDAHNTACRDMSDRNFTIKNISPLVINIPNGNEAWEPGSQHEISWTPENPNGTVKLEYSENGGSTWQIIANNTTDDGCYTWTVPMVNTFMARVKVTSLATPTNNDMSDANFTIGACQSPSLWADDFKGTYGSSKLVNVEISGNTSPIAAFGFKIMYNTNHLRFVELQKGDLTIQWVQISGSENDPGVITVGGFNTEAIAAGSSGALVKVKFMVICDNCDECEQSQIMLTDLLDDLAGMNVCYGIFGYGTACALGDVNMDENITPADALCAFQIYLNGGTPRPGSPCDTECALESSDATCDGMITPQDALLIFQAYINGQNSMECPSTLAKKSDRNIEIKCSSLSALPQDTVKIPVQVNNGKSLTAFGLTFEYPQNMLEYQGLERTPFTKNWIALDGEKSDNNMITIGGFQPHGSKKDGVAELFILKFRVKDGAKGSGQFVFHNLQDDLAEARANAGGIRVDVAGLTPKDFGLAQNFPNPFNMTTEITFHLPKPGQVQITIVDVTGRKVRDLVSENMSAGTHNITWNGLDNDGRELATGLYMCILKAGGERHMIKMLLLK